MAYSPEMDGIAERTNGLVAPKARCLLLNPPTEIGQSFWPKAFHHSSLFAQPFAIHPSSNTIAR